MSKKYEIVNDNGEGIYEIIPENSYIKYYVNERKKTVVAVMNDCKKQVLNEVFKSIGYLTPAALDLLKDTYRGKSKCIGDDVFDPIKGMQIAREHMLAKYYTDYFEMLFKYSAATFKRAQDLEDKIFAIQARATKFKILSNDNWLKAHDYKSQVKDLT